MTFLITCTVYLDREKLLAFAQIKMEDANKTSELTLIPELHDHSLAPPFNDNPCFIHANITTIVFAPRMWLKCFLTVKS